ncbi:pentapeptide repeat family protein [Caldimonas brevitalea]|uniref:Pentapeptide repeat family protein n=1 Tax=Caldimonas brevitalea TaxID=413882 RepID=A0A0G3BHR4_9BURK|nr:pentapeptide repeat family protein [Caldimonas brevitalea]
MKPQHLSVLHRCFEREGKAWLCVTTMAMLQLGDSPRLRSEQELWQAVPPLLPPDVPLDACMPKTGGEYLVTGRAHAPAGDAPRGGVEVEVRLGSLSKRLHAFGERVWAGDRACDPAPFTPVPLDWTQAYGGAGFEANPLGIGLSPAADGQPQALPRLEYPHAPSRGPQTAITPASFAPLPPMWPQRKRHDGTYGEDWLKQDYPGFPRDLNWRFFNLASEDQWQPRPFTGDEPYELRHLHPELPVLSGRLPGIRPVVAVQTHAMDAERARFLDSQLTTVWFFPELQAAVLVWHALMQAENEFADEVSRILVAAEWSARPRERAHYLRAIRERLDETIGGIKMLEDEELLPDGLVTVNEALDRHRRLLGAAPISLQRVDEKLAQAQAQLRERLQSQFGAAAAQGLDQSQAQLRRELSLPDLAAAAAHDPKALMGLAKTLQQQAPALTAKAASLVQQRGAASLQALRASGGAHNTALQAILPKLKPSAASAAQASGPNLVAALEAGLAELRAGLPPAQAEGLPNIDPKLKALASQSGGQHERMARLVAHMQAPPSAVDAGIAARWRDGASRAREQGRSFARLKLGGGNFAGMDLSGVDFTEAQLEGVDFTGANLTAAIFKGASLAHAVLRQAKLDNAVFDDANLGKADLQGASCVGASFANATLHHTRLDEAVMFGSRLAKLTLLEVSALKTQWVQVDLSHAVWVKSQLAGGNFTRARLPRASFIECSLPEAVFAQANLESVDFVTCNLERAVLDGCEAPNVRFVHGSRLNGVSLRGSQAPRSSWRGMPLQGADLSHAVLDGADLAEVQASGANFYRSSLKGAMLMKGQFQQVSFAGSNMMNAIVQHAQLQGADLRGTNLFAADLMRIDVDADTRFDGALLSKARTQPQRKVERPEPRKGAA